MSSLAGAATVISLIGQVGSTYAQVQAANQTAAAANAEAASIGQVYAGLERDARRTSSLKIGQAHAIMAASGVDPSRGSPLFQDLENARQAELEALDIRRFGQVQVQSKQYEASLAKAKIPGALLGGVAGAGSILTSWYGKRDSAPEYGYAGPAALKKFKGPYA